MTTKTTRRQRWIAGLAISGTIAGGAAPAVVLTAAPAAAVTASAPASHAGATPAVFYNG